ncbi:unnamed protein product, partial [Tetraodon nigroviridis]
EMLVTQERLAVKVRKGKQGLQEPRAYKVRKATEEQPETRFEINQ